MGWGISNGNLDALLGQSFSSSNSSYLSVTMTSGAETAAGGTSVMLAADLVTTANPGTGGSPGRTLTVSAVNDSANTITLSFQILSFVINLPAQSVIGYDPVTSELLLSFASEANAARLVGLGSPTTSLSVLSLTPLTAGTKLTLAGFTAPQPLYTLPTISGTVAGQTTTDAVALTPLSGVTISEPIADETETVTVNLSSVANGKLSNPEAGSYNAATGVYSVTGTAAQVSAALDGLVFTPTAHQVAPGQTVTTKLVVIDTNSAGIIASNWTTTIVTTAVAVAPNITGTVAGQVATDNAPMSPFSKVTLTDLNAGQTESLTVTLSAPANGTLSNLGAGSYDAATGVYSVSGSAADVTAALDGLVFTPTAHQVPPGQAVTTTFSIASIDTAGQVVTDSTTAVVTTAIAVPPTISGSVAGQKIGDNQTVSPFSRLVVGDLNAGQSETVSVTLSTTANGALSNLGSGSYNAAAGVYIVAGSAQAVTTALNGLVFVPTQHQVAPGKTVTTTFTILDSDTAGQTIKDSTTTVAVKAIAVPPTIDGSVSDQQTDDVSSVSPFRTIIIGDLNAKQTETVSVTLSEPTNGTLSNLGIGSYDAANGIYSVSGSAAAVTAALNALVFTPAQHQVPPGQTVTTSFTIKDTDTAGQTVSDTTTTVLATALATPPSIAGSIAAQATTDMKSVAPFAAVTISDLNAGQTETVTITLSAAGNGTLSNLGGGSYDTATGVYSVSGSAAMVTSAVQGLVFTPTAHQAPPGQTIATTFTIRDSDTAGQSVADRITSVVATAVAVPIAITGATSAQAAADEGSVAPFGTLIISDLNAGQTETVTVTLSQAANGTLSNLRGGRYDAATGVYSLSGSAADVTVALQGLLFTPARHQVAPGQTVTTAFSIQVEDSAAQTADDNSTSVIATAIAVPIAIEGALAGQRISDASVVSPFRNIEISDPNADQLETVRIALSAPANGTLSNFGGGAYDPHTGVYTLSGNASAVSAALRDLVFTPAAHQVAPGQTVTTGFALSVTDTAGQSSADSTTSVMTTAVAVLPSIAGAIAGQTIGDATPVSPFSRLTITDANAGQTETVTVTLSAAGNGALSNLAGGSYNAASGVYSVTGSAAGVTAALQGLVFTPTAHQVPPGQTVTTSFTIRDSDTAGQAVSDTLTSVVATAVAVPIQMAGAIAGQITSEQVAVAPFAHLTIIDLNAGQTQTISVTVSNPGNGTLSNLGGGKYNGATGVYSVTGSAASVTAALEGLVFTPTLHQVPPGQSVTTSFIVEDTDGFGLTSKDSSSSVVARAVAVSPTILGSVAAQVVSDGGSCTPFSQITIGDLNAGQTETVSIALSAAANGVLSNLGIGSYNAATGVYSVAGDFASVTDALRGLVFTPTPHQVPPGQTVITSFAIQDTDTAGQMVSDAATSVVATAVAVPPSIAGARAAQAGNDQSSLRPFANVTIGDLNMGQTETVTVTLTNAANGTLSNLGSGSYNAAAGVYSVTGNASSVTAALQALVFTPAAHLVPPGQTVATGFTIKDTDTAGQIVSDSNTTVIAMSVAVPPSIAGSLAGQACSDAASLAPFTHVTIGDLNAGQIETLTVTLSMPSNGRLSNLGGGTYDATTGVYSVSGSSAAVTAALQALIFTPTLHQVAPGQTVTTGFVIRDTDTAGATIADNTTTVIATAVVPPVITGIASVQSTTDKTAVAPFAGFIVTDANPAQTETVTVSLSTTANGTWSKLAGGSYNSAAGTYTVTGTAAAVSAALSGLIFTPTLHQVAPGQAVTTRFTIKDVDTAGQIATASISLTATAVASPITISGSVSGQSTTDQTAISPFADMAIADPNSGQAETLTVTLSNPANGTLTNLAGGSYNAGTGVFSISGSIGTVTTALRGLVFTPTAAQVAPGQTVTTSFTVTDTDTAGQTVSNGATSVVATAQRTAPDQINVTSYGDTTEIIDATTGSVLQTLPPSGSDSMQFITINGMQYARNLASANAIGLDPSKLRDYDGNDLGSASGWKLLGLSSVRVGSAPSYILVNPQNGRWAEVAVQPDGSFNFGNHGHDGDTRVVGIYIDPLVEQGIVVRNSPIDSQVRFLSDVEANRLALLGAYAEPNGSDFQDMFFKLTNHSADHHDDVYLRAILWGDGNIQYANYMNTSQFLDWANAAGMPASDYANWLTKA